MTRYLVLLLLFWNNIGFTDQNIKCNLTFYNSQTDYTRFEPIMLKYEITNGTNQVIYIEKNPVGDLPYFADLDLLCEPAPLRYPELEQRKVPFELATNNEAIGGRQNAVKTIPLPPGKTYLVKFDLIGLFPVYYIGKYTLFVKPGRYTIEDNGKQTVHEPSSMSMEFQIVPPSVDECLLFSNMYEETAHKGDRVFIKPWDYRGVGAMIIALFDGSKYKQYSYYWLAYQFYKEPSGLAIMMNCFEKQMQLYPDGPMRSDVEFRMIMALQTPNGLVKGMAGIWNIDVEKAQALDDQHTFRLGMSINEKEMIWKNTIETFRNQQNELTKIIANKLQVPVVDFDLVIRLQSEADKLSGEIADASAKLDELKAAALSAAPMNESAVPFAADGSFSALKDKLIRDFGGEWSIDQSYNNGPRLTMKRPSSGNNPNGVLIICPANILVNDWQIPLSGKAVPLRSVIKTTHIQLITNFPDNDPDVLRLISFLKTVDP